MFVKGQSGNPSGRPTIPEELKNKLKGEYGGVIDFWIRSYKDESLRWDYRDKAATNIANYAYGKPKEIIDVDLQGRVENVTIEIVKKLNESKNTGTGEV